MLMTQGEDVGFGDARLYLVGEEPLKGTKLPSFNFSPSPFFLANVLGVALGSEVWKEPIYCSAGVQPEEGLHGGKMGVQMAEGFMMWC